ncbi:helix-turn-helix transcriptional regulator [Solwaraspora sp. WMMD1047]|uniref:helix-turn-helix domain-containing protein n=1 Tax=Solwaraspora sp. WMMD1047 TaxID=3016102 RepID=UPI002417AD09|nr:helix-turn-helix transcriptional regulator [Solwaraspora sp. WMMD1047]MDG4827863.1 helix-turn-helix transcriptional regulator [Solwaraspora sp. WMMD1047]
MSELPKTVRRLRTERKLTQRQLARSIKVSASLITAIENGRLIPQPDTTDRLDLALGAEGKVREAVATARDEATELWLRPWTYHESRATMLRWFEPSLIPGLLQTEDYTRAVLRGGRLPESEVERTTKDRRERQAATVGRPDPPMLTAVIGEFALRCGPPEVMKDQLDHLISATHQTRTQVLVIPNGTGLHAGLAGAFVLATLPGRQRVGYVDGPLRGDVTTDADDIAKLELAWEIVSGLALPVDLSRKLIEKVADEYE